MKTWPFRTRLCASDGSSGATGAPEGVGTAAGAAMAADAAASAPAAATGSAAVATRTPDRATNKDSAVRASIGSLLEGAREWPGGAAPPRERRPSVASQLPDYAPIRHATKVATVRKRAATADAAECRGPA